MGLQDRDYYREHWKKKRLEDLRPSFPPRHSQAIKRLLFIAACAGCLFFGIRSIKLQRQLDAADRVISQQVQQLREYRERESRVIQSVRPPAR